MLPVLVILCMVALIVASIMDLRKREVADWLNYSLIAAGFGVNLIYSLYHWDRTYILESVIGFAFSFILSLIMYYSGQWGGGDSKMLMALGACLGLPLNLDAFILKFYANILFAGAIYGLAWMLALAALHHKKVVKHIRQISSDRKQKILRYVFSGLVALLLVVIIVTPSYVMDTFAKLIFLSLLLFALLLQYLYLLAKAVEQVCMIEDIPVEKLTEGDWIVNDVVVGGKRICGPADLGIEKRQIEQLKKHHIKKVTVKQGIPFIPSFLLGYIYTLITGAIMFVGLFI